MSERKVLNKYYPPDYDPSLIPKLKLAKDRQYVIRVMAPFHMRCKTCGNYIYKGTKFNSRKETVQDDDYLGLRIFRFYIKCTKCVAEITFKTDPENQDYVIEHGATRNFEAEKLLEKQEKELQRQKEEDEGNPMKLLEMRTRDSKREMERMENLEELRDLNQRKAKVNYEGMLLGYQETDEERKKREIDEDEKEVIAIFGKNKVRRLNDDGSDGEDAAHPIKNKVEKKATERIAPSCLLLPDKLDVQESSKKTFLPSNKQVIKKKAALLGIVKKKPTVITDAISSQDSNSVTSKTPRAVSNTENTKSAPLQNVKAPVDGKQLVKKAVKKSSAASGGGLSLLGSYGSGQSSTSEDED